MLSTMTGIRPEHCRQKAIAGGELGSGTIGIQSEEPVFLLLIGHDVTSNASVSESTPSKQVAR